jgi:hypothetical protein
MGKAESKDPCDLNITRERGAYWFRTRKPSCLQSVKVLGALRLCPMIRKRIPWFRSG